MWGVSDHAWRMCISAQLGRGLVWEPLIQPDNSSGRFGLLRNAVCSVRVMWSEQPIGNAVKHRTHGTDSCFARFEAKHATILDSVARSR